MSREFGKALDLTGADQRFRDRFWSKVDRRGADECWEWLAYRMSNGYGMFTIVKGTYVTASRAALAMVEPIAVGQVACHRCDNPPCVNPGHLFVGTGSENALDSVQKGRARRSRGEAHRDARLTPSAVAFIRSQDLSVYGRKTQLAREFGVSLTAIRRVAANQTWTHVA